MEQHILMTSYTVQFFYENEDDAEQFVNDGIGEKIIKVHLSDESYKVLKRKGVIR